MASGYQLPSIFFDKLQHVSVTLLNFKNDVEYKYRNEHLPMWEVFSKWCFVWTTVNQQKHLKKEIPPKRAYMEKIGLSFHKKIHRVTSRWIKCQNYTNVSSNCFPSHRIHQIWFLVTFICPKNEEFIAETKSNFAAKSFYNKDIEMLRLVNNWWFMDYPALFLL